jgi:TetR/AcrR family transcriptional repressor of bet genes
MPRVNVKDKRKQQLIDANIASIAKRGLSETTIAHVSQGAGMSRGIVNFYFTTKEAMMQETCQYLADEYAASWERALEKQGKDATAEQALRAIIASQFTTATCNQKKLAVWVAFWGHASSHKEYQKIIATADAAFTEKLRELWVQTDSVAVDGDTFSYELHALIRGSWLNFLLTAQASERDALAAKCDAYISRSLSQAVVAVAPAKKTKAKTSPQADVSNVTDLATAKKKIKPVEDDQAALGDLFALGN